MSFFISSPKAAGGGGNGGGGGGGDRGSVTSLELRLADFLMIETTTDWSSSDTDGDAGGWGRYTSPVTL